MLDGTNLAENKERQIFCTACHGKLYGPKGFGFGTLGDTGKGEDRITVGVMM
jgi:hypothetical protein